MKNRKREIFITALLILCALITLTIVYCYLGYYMRGDFGNYYKDLHDQHGIRARMWGMSDYDPNEPLIIVPTVPWSIILGQIFYAGFLPLRHAELLNLFMHIAVYAVSALLFFSRLKKYLSVSKILILCLLPIACYSYSYSIFWGNDGGIICLLMIDTILIIRRHPYIAGVLISLCMCKPQIAGIICIMFLIRGNVKPIIIGTIICLAAWFAASTMLHVTMLQLFADCFNVGAQWFTYKGVFHLLVFYGIDHNLVLAANVCVGIVYMMALYTYLKSNIRSEKLLDWVAYIPACIASTIYFYKNGSDYVILIYPVAFGVLICLTDTVSRKDFIIELVFIVFYLLMTRLFVYFCIAIIDSSIEARAVYSTFESVIIMLIGILQTRLLIKYQEEQCIL